MVQMSGYIKKQQEEDTKDLATLPVFELAIYMIRGESWVVLIPIVHYGSSEWKKNLWALLWSEIQQNYFC